MTSRYHIKTAPAPAPFPYPAKFRLGEGDDYVKYGHAAFEQGRRGGDDHWTPEVITQTWYQAETGRVPISGAGYGGAFAGPGFDAIWLDMSEIVRPTRDGIHGREAISTAVLLGRRLPALEFGAASSFGAAGDLLSELPPQVELPLPLLFDPLPLPLPGAGAQQAILRAAARLGTLALLRAADWRPEMAEFAGTVAPILAPGDDSGWLAAAWLQAARLVEIEVEDDDEDALAAALALVGQVRALNPRAVLALRLPLGPASAVQAGRAAAAGLDAVHLCADEVGYELDGDDPRFLAEAVQDVHGRLVATGLRDQGRRAPPLPRRRRGDRRRVGRAAHRQPRGRLARPASGSPGGHGPARGAPPAGRNGPGHPAIAGRRCLSCLVRPRRPRRPRTGPRPGRDRGRPALAGRVDPGHRRAGPYRASAYLGPRIPHRPLRRRL
ncbi:MAG: hypothetical protein P8129_09980 [Anaerolineae bacterium]